MRFDRGAVCLRFDIDTFSTRHAFIADVGMGEYAYIPKILKMADDFGVKLQFCTCGQGLKENSAAHADILAHGHSIDSHLYTHTVSLLDDYETIEKELVLTEREFGDQKIHWTGIGATGMYPDGIRSKSETQSLLARRGYRWCSAKYNRELGIKQMQPFWLQDDLLEIPCAGMSDRHYFYDVNAPVNRYSEMVVGWIGQARNEGLVYCVCLHPGVLAKFDPELIIVTSALKKAASVNIPLLTMYDLYEYERLTSRL